MDRLQYFFPGVSSTDIHIQLTLEQPMVWGTDPPCSQKSACNIYIASLLYTWFPHKLSSISVDSATGGSHSTIGFTIKKNLCICGPVQLKPAVIKGQLCMFPYAVGQILIFLLYIIQKYEFIDK